MNKKIPLEKVKGGLSVLAGIAIAGCIAVFIPAFRSALIGLGETLVRRQLNRELWNYQLLFMACAGLVFSVSLVCIFSRRFQAAAIPQKQKNSVYAGVVILLTVIFAGVLVVLAASNRAIWVDEAYSLAPVKHSWKEILLCEQADVHPPLYFLLEKAWSLIFGDGVFAMKCLSILPVVLTMLVTARVLGKEVSPRAAVLFLLCFIASESVVHYSIEIRMYSWALCFITLAALCGWYIVKTGNTLWWALFILCAEAAAYTHYYAAAIAVIGYALLLCYILKYDRKNVMKALVSALAGAAAYLPWLPTAVNSFTRASGDFWIPPLTISDVVSYGSTVFQSGNRIAALCFFGLFFLVFCLFVAKKNKTRRDGFAFGGLCCILALALAGILIAVFIRPLFVARYLFPGYGLVWLFFAIEGAAIKRKEVFALMCAGLLALGIVTLSSSIYTERKEHQDFMGFYTYMSEQIQPGDMFIFPPQEVHMVGVSAALFSGHPYAYETGKAGVSFEEMCWSLFGNTRIDYEALSDAERFQREGAWLIVSEQDGDGRPSDFVLPPGAQARWRGLFGWGSYAFNLYRIGAPAAFAGTM